MPGFKSSLLLIAIISRKFFESRCFAPAKLWAVGTCLAEYKSLFTIPIRRESGGFAPETQRAEASRPFGL